MFIVCLIGIFIALCVRNKFAIKYPDNPPSLFYTLIFGLLYLLWYWSWVDEKGDNYSPSKSAASPSKATKMSKDEYIALMFVLFVTCISFLALSLCDLK